MMTEHTQTGVAWQQPAEAVSAPPIPTAIPAVIPGQVAEENHKAARTLGKALNETLSQARQLIQSHYDFLGLGRML